MQRVVAIEPKAMLILWCSMPAIVFAGASCSRRKGHGLLLDFDEAVNCAMATASCWRTARSCWWRGRRSPGRDQREGAARSRATRMAHRQPAHRRAVRATGFRIRRDHVLEEMLRGSARTVASGRRAVRARARRAARASSRTTIMSASRRDRALYRLMAWLSPAYPVGAFSYSERHRMGGRERRHQGCRDACSAGSPS